MQSTVQAGPRAGLRHLGVPTCGAADPLSLALANRAVGNAWDAGGIELTLTGAALRAEGPVLVAVTGAPCEASVDGAPAGQHEPFTVPAGAELRLGPARRGCRSYLAVRGGLAVPSVLGSASTYLPAGLGGHEGRALRGGDALEVAGGAAPLAPAPTPARLRPPFGEGWTLRAVSGPEADVLDDEGLAALFGAGWRASRASDRVGVRLEGPSLSVREAGRMDSVPALVGTVQLPAGGQPIVLGADGGTTGGYPRAAQVIRADRHLIGQLRPGVPVRLLRWERADADAVLAGKDALVAAWVPGFRL